MSLNIKTLAKMTMNSTSTITFRPWLKKTKGFRWQIIENPIQFDGQSGLFTKTSWMKCVEKKSDPKLWG